MERGLLGIPSGVTPCSPSAGVESGSMAFSSSRHNFVICVSSAFMSVIAVANCCNSTSSAAMPSADTASVGMGVGDRAVGDAPDCHCLSDQHMYARAVKTYNAYSFSRNGSGNLGRRFRWG